ncbi:MAG: TolC family protein [Epsilonproteobacteria bacterium]|nr:TolC family protein [Campylobacterota bacterium]
MLKYAKGCKMKKLLIILPLIAMAENFNDIRTGIENSLKYKLAKTKVEIYKKRLKSAKAKNYGELNFEYSALHLFSTPQMKLSMPQPVGVDEKSAMLIYKEVQASLPVGDNDRYFGALTYSYPIFTGYAITNLIDKSKLELIKSKLELNNVKRELLLNAANLYSMIYAIKYQIKALLSAKAALLSAKNKALGFYQEGLINKTAVEEINAKYYEIIADIKNLQAQKISLLNTLSYLVNKKIKKIEGIIDLNKISFNPQFDKRPDVKAIKESLKISQKDIALAKSKLYPQLMLEASLKRESDNFVLSKNDYQNKDKSFVGIFLRYNIFDAGARKNAVEMAKTAKLSTLIFYNDYLNKIKTDYQNDKSEYEALFYRLKAAKKEIEARKSYFEYIRAKFNEGLADSSDLNDAIAKLAAARAKMYGLKAKIFFLNVKLKLNGGEYVY